MEPEDKDKLIKEYEEEIEQLKTLNETLQNHVDLKEAENEVYKQDFETERNDRQRIHAEYEILITRMEESWTQDEVDKQTIDNLGQIIKNQDEEIRVLKSQLNASSRKTDQNEEDEIQALTAQVNTYSREVDKQKGLVTQYQTEVQDLKMELSNEKERFLKAYYQEKARAKRLEEQIERMKETNNVQTRKGRSYSYSSSHHYDSFPSDSDSISPPPFLHQSVSDSSYFPFSPTPSPSPYINERLNKPGIIREDVINRHHDHTTSIPSHIRPQFSKEEMYKRFRGSQMRREEYERPRVSPAYTSSIPDFIQPQFSEEEMKRRFKPRVSPAYTSSIPDSVQPQVSEEEMRRRFKPRVSPAYTSSIPDSVQPQVSEEEMRRRFKNRQQPYNQYRRADSEEYLQAKEDADKALLEVDHIRRQYPIHPSYNHKPGNKKIDRDDIPYDPNLVCPKCDKQYLEGEIQKLRRHINSQCSNEDSDKSDQETDGIDEEIKKMADKVRRESRGPTTAEVLFDDGDSSLPYDPNLVCPKCGKQYRVGEIQKLRRHINEFCTGMR